VSLRNVEGLLHGRGIEISHETVRFWWNRFVPMFAAALAEWHAFSLPDRKVGKG
jgi:putative transposase